jgi:succinate dehydrogenase / fumarate reductase cytochrome b subunit
MAIAGIVMTIYLIVHMLTNLTFFDKSQFSSFYTWYNQSIIRWLVLAMVLMALSVHVRYAITIRRINAKARSIDYKRHDKFKIPALFVTLSIVFLLGFIGLHIFQTLSFDAENTYEELYRLFKQPIMTLTYLAGLFVLLMHLQHSLANVLQTLGKSSKTCAVFVWGMCVALIGGFASIPFYISVVMS